MQHKNIFLLSLGHLSVDLNCAAFPAVLPFFVQEYGLDYTAVGGLMFASSFLSSVVQPVTGYLADKGERHWFMVLGILMAGASISACGFLRDYWAIFTAATMLGVGSAIFHPEGARLVNTISGKAKGKSMSLFSVGGNGGWAFGPLLAVFLASTLGLKGLVCFGGISLVVAGILLLKIPEIHAESEAAKAAAKAEAAQQAAEMATQAAVGTSAKADGDGDGRAEAAAARARLEAEREAAKERNDWSGFIRLTLVILFQSTVKSGVNSFLPLLCITALGASKAAAGSTLSVMEIAGLVATLIGGRLADKWGFVPMMRGCCWLLVPVMVLLAMTGSMWGVYLLLIPFSFGIRGSYSSTVVLGQTYLAKNVGFASGVTLGLSFSLGGIVVPGLGVLADKFGLPLVMWLLAVIALLAAIASVFLPKPREQ